ncbi:membrane protein [Nonomuraea antimicrobica]|uniref:Membrane protein n=2 Tax=Nonomuraea antimicrobica TaxID=561173 RepID=A0ABP7DH24_9ACTN
MRTLPAMLVLVVLSGCGSGSALSQTVIDQAARQGVAPDLMYVVDLPGYELAEQSAGAVGEEGFGAVYTAPGGQQVELRVDRGPYKCVGTCERDGDGWYTEHEGRQEYVAVRASHYVRLTSQAEQVERAVLKQAAEGARPAVGDGTPSPPPSPVERGDLPENGDGAPIQPTGPGG